MDRKIYRRGLHGQHFYNGTEMLALALLKRKTPAGVKYEKRLHYGEGKYQYVNIYSPENKNKKPVFIYIHGGGWISGITDMRNSYVAEWASLGFYCASVSYTYAPQKTFPHQIREIFSAIDFILDKAEKENADTENIILAGESAGGYYISYAASCTVYKELYDILDIKFRRRDSFRINALLSICGCFNIDHLANDEKPQSKFIDMKTMLTSYSGMTTEELRKWVKTPEGKLISPHAGKGFPPVCFIWAVRDYLKHETFDFKKHLDEYSVPSCLIKADREISLHAWSLAYFTPAGKKCFKAAEDFILPLSGGYFIKNNGKWQIKK